MAARDQNRALCKYPVVLNKIVNILIISNIKLKNDYNSVPSVTSSKSPAFTDNN